MPAKRSDATAATPPTAGDAATPPTAGGAARAPRAPKPAKPPRPWARQAAGTYASADGRFELEGDGTGRWFVRDAEQADELGLPRTLGPYATLAAAKDGAEAQRGRPVAESPLAARLAEAAARRAAEPSGDHAGRPGRPTARKGSTRPAPPPTPALPDPPPPPPPPTWLDLLEGRDRDAAAVARRWIRELDALGIRGGETLVRRDLEADQPTVAGALLAQALRQAVAARLDPASLATIARSAGVAVPEGSDGLAALAVARTLEVVVDTLVNVDRLEGAPRDLPGWEVRETGPADRRIRLATRDLA